MKNNGIIINENEDLLVTEANGYRFAVSKTDGSITELKKGQIFWSQKGTTIKGIDDEGNNIGPIEVGDTILNYNSKIDENGKDISSKTETSYKTENNYKDQKFTISNYTGGWKILGADEKTGQLIIISDDAIGPDSDETTEDIDKYFNFCGGKGYVNGINELNKISKLYAQGKYADIERTRSINIEDINRIIGYELKGTGETIIFKNDNGTIKYDSSTRGSGISTLKTFYYFDEKGNTHILGEGESKSYTYTAYFVYVSNLISSNSKAYNVFTYNKNNEGLSYWLGSQFTWTNPDNCTFGLRCCFPYMGDEYLASSDVFGSVTGDYDVNHGHYNPNKLRPAVYLKSNVKLTGTSSDGWTIE